MLAAETPRTTHSGLKRIVTALEWPMAILALAVIPALLLDEGAAFALLGLIFAAFAVLFYFLNEKRVRALREAEAERQRGAVLRHDEVQHGSDGVRRIAVVQPRVPAR